MVVYGVNHVAAGKATYANTAPHARPRLNGIVSLYDSMYGDSVAEYLPDVDSSKGMICAEDGANRWDSHTAVIPYSTDNPNGRFLWRGERHAAANRLSRLCGSLKMASAFIMKSCMIARLCSIKNKRFAKIV